MSDKSTIAARLTRCIVTNAGVKPEQVKPEAHFVNDLNLDSIDALELLMFIEDEFSINVPDAEWEKVNTVQDALTIVEQKVGVAA